MKELYLTTSSRDGDSAGRRVQSDAGGLFRMRAGVGGLEQICRRESR